jgi:alpha-D-xyloside xylohydrolase
LLSTAAITATVDLLTGTVSFADSAGRSLLAEKKTAGRLLQPVMHEGQSLWRVKQSFETDESDAYYGLGQHQDDVWNYKGKQVQFFQNNTEVAIPYALG